MSNVDQGNVDQGNVDQGNVDQGNVDQGNVKLLVRQKRSLIGRAHPQHRVIKGLGLRGPGSEVVVANTPSFRGMIKKVMHLVEVQAVEEK